MRKRFFVLGAIALAGATAWGSFSFLLAPEAEATEAASKVAETAAKELGKEAASELVSRALGIEVAAASELVSRSVKGAGIAADLPQFAIGGVIAVKGYQACLSEQATTEGCLFAGRQAVSLGKALEPKWGVWTDLQNEFDVTRFCDPVYADVLQARLDGSNLGPYDELVLQAWAEAKCDVRMTRSLNFWERVGRFASAFI